MKFLKSAYISIFFISLLPVVEVKGGLILGAINGLSLVWCSLICALASILLIPLLLKFMYPLLNWLKNVKFFKKLVTKTLNKAEKEKQKILDKDKLKKKSKLKTFFIYFSIFAFVAVPLPGTGVYTGCLLSAIMNVNKFKAGIAVFLGNIISIVLSALTVAGVILLF